MNWTKESIHQLLDDKPAAVLKACLAIYARQTADEQSTKTTKEHNGVGFGAFDAEFCSDIAKRALRAQQRGWSFHLSEKQLAVLRNKMKRYHRQLIEIANQKQAQKTPAPVQVATDMRTAEQRAQDALLSDALMMQAIQEAEAAEEEARMLYKMKRDGLMCSCENYDGEALCPACLTAD